MIQYLVLCKGGRKRLIEAISKQAAFEKAQAQWRDVSGVVDLNDPAVSQALIDHLYPPVDEAPVGQGTLNFGAREPLTIYTDGSVLGNPGPAGWAYVRSDGRKDSGFLGTTGNNVAELNAVWQALQSCPRGATVTIVTDSRNVLGWLAEGWKRRNVDIRRVADEIDRLIAAQKLRVRYELVSGHAGLPETEEVHQLAEKAARGKKDS